MAVSPHPLRLSLVLALVATAASADLAMGHQPAAVAGVLPVRVWEAGPTPTIDRTALRSATLALLDAEGVPIAWRMCERPEDCAAELMQGVTVILSPAPRRACGTTALAPDRASATVIVSVPCVADAVGRLRRSGGARADPGLATLTLVHLLGVVIAHELGHAMGLAHTTTGLMRARLGVEEVRALRAGRLGFSALQVTRMRNSRLWAEAVVARRR